MSDAPDTQGEDVLEDAIAALREETSASGPPERAAATRRAVLSGASKRARRRQPIVRLVLPLAAVFVVSAAWAAATGRLPRALSAVVEALRGPSRELPSGGDPMSPSHGASPPTTDRDDAGADTTPAAADGATTSADAGTTSVEPDRVVAPVASAPSGTASAASARARSGAEVDGAKSVAREAHGPDSVAREDAGVRAAVDPEEARYRAAHEVHFVARDWSRALRAWDDYLAAYPKGRFAPEARYNRALALVRLGRRDEAREALRPFAAGELGGYRRREAKELIDAMD